VGVQLRDFKRIALRACRTDEGFAAMIYAAATVLNSSQQTLGYATGRDPLVAILHHWWYDF
jgi:hypothetical protein